MYNKSRLKTIDITVLPRREDQSHSVMKSTYHIKYFCFISKCSLRNTIVANKRENHN